MMTDQVSRIIPGRYPPPGTSPVADAIRVRRGSRGITPLDAALLHVPPVASGWNSLLGAVRTQGKLPGDVRELMILRVAAINRAAFEWIQHEPVGRKEGLTTAQLYVVRDADTPLPPSAGILSPLQTSALMFADASTSEVKVGEAVTEALRKDLEAWARELDPEDVETRTQDLLVEAALVVATYNMVSRFLVAVDVAGMSDDAVPWPVERKEHFVTMLPWLVFANSLLTNLSMWECLIPFLLPNSRDPTSSSRSYNVLIHSQRGHGRSTLPALSRPTTIPALASDIAHLLQSLNIPTPVHSVIGVSQGGAAALALARSYPSLTRSVVACDTSPKTPSGNKQAWAGRIGLVYGGVSAEDILSEGVDGGELGKGAKYAVKVGIGHLADVTVPRWFPPQSRCGSEEAERGERHRWALSDYDIYQADENGKELLKSPVERVLLVAGGLDGGGNVGKTLQRLRDEWNAVRCQDTQAKAVEYAEIGTAGHLPMVDETEQFAQVLRGFLDGF
ncbi:putative carboxymuconolactone decarboxylase family protein [Lyophyllum shimeji]|uniref:Carboxymuconolactone decarboxylase family protein n=1 Tax=Lyophyllum shimeji TaxID=47721 RepID=A0A9P3PH26_LYOSH|nr:putative carboxymuconolactone decarboxylase family protein [Lyophyllum shimeji]